MFQQFNLTEQQSAISSTQLIQLQQQYQQLFNLNPQALFSQQTNLNGNCNINNINNINNISNINNINNINNISNINNNIASNISPFQSLQQMQSQQLASLQQLQLQIEMCKQSLESHILTQNNALLLSSLLQQNQQTSLIENNNMNYQSQLYPQIPIFHLDPNIPTSNLSNNSQYPAQRLQQIQQKSEESTTSSDQILAKQEEDPQSSSGCTLHFSSSSSLQTSSSIKIRIPASVNLKSKIINESKQKSANTLSSDEKTSNIHKKQAKKQTLSDRQFEKTNENKDSDDADFDEIKTEEQQMSQDQDEDDTCSLEQDIASEVKSKKPKRIETAIDNKSRNFSKNLLKSFFKYAQQQNAGDKRFLFNFKRYTTCNKTGNQFIIKLLNNSPYSDIFNEFLGEPANEWIRESKVHNRVEQVKFLEMCRDGTVSTLQKREFPKKKSFFSLKRR